MNEDRITIYVVVSNMSELFTALSTVISSKYPQFVNREIVRLSVTAGLPKNDYGQTVDVVFGKRINDKENLPLGL